jgi:hypothetical protein
VTCTSKRTEKRERKKKKKRGTPLKLAEPAKNSVGLSPASSINTNVPVLRGGAGAVGAFAGDATWPVVSSLLGLVEAYISIPSNILQHFSSQPLAESSIVQLGVSASVIVIVSSYRARQPGSSTRYRVQPCNCLGRQVVDTQNRRHFAQHRKTDWLIAGEGAEAWPCVMTCKKTALASNDGDTSSDCFFLLGGIAGVVLSNRRI